MLRAFVAGAHAGAEFSGIPDPVTLAVTVLTSDADAGAFDARLAAAVEARCTGVVCSGLEVEQVNSVGLASMVPGIRPAGSAADDQARIVTPGEAISFGASWRSVVRSRPRPIRPPRRRRSRTKSRPRWP